jgi:hypothetical protein
LPTNPIVKRKVVFPGQTAATAEKHLTAAVGAPFNVAADFMPFPDPHEAVRAPWNKFGFDNFFGHRPSHSSY